MQTVILEYQGGTQAGFFEFARRVAKSGGLQISQLNSTRVARQLVGAEILATKASRYILSVDARAEDVFSNALKIARSQIIGNREAAAAGDAEGIKQMRVGLRRLRAIAKLFQASLGNDALRQIVPVAKGFGKTLGHVRDLDVFATITMPAIMAADTLEESDTGVLFALVSGIESKRHAAHQGVAGLMSSPEFTDFCLRLTEYITTTGWQRTCHDDLNCRARVYGAKALDKRLRKVMTLGADLASAPAHARHPLRLELKKIRYALHAFRPLYAKDLRKPYLSALSRLQDEFGLLNDAVVARQMALTAAAPAGRARKYDITRALGASFVIGWSARQLERQSEAVFVAWQEFAAMEPFWRDGIYKSPSS